MTGNAARNPASRRAFLTLRKVLAEVQWNSDPDEEHATFHIDLGPPHVPVSDALAAIVSETGHFLFYVNFGPLAPPEKRDEVARFMTLANWGLAIGNFEMDYEDGFMRFKSSVSFGNGNLTEALIRSAILAAMAAIEVYAEPLIHVLAGSQRAQEAFIEAKSRPVLKAQ